MTCKLACVLLISATNVQTIGSGPARVMLLQSGEGFTVLYENHLVSGDYVTPFEVQVDGVTVTGNVEALGGDDPDDLVVFPPQGYWCDPCRVTVDEDQTGSVELYPEIGA